MKQEEKQYTCKKCNKLYDIKEMAIITSHDGCHPWSEMVFVCVCCHTKHDKYSDKGVKF